jgi:hypothetical protein
MPRLVIKSHRPWQMAIAIIALSMVISVFTWFLLDNNHWQVIYNQLSGNLKTKDLIETNQTLEDANSELQGKVLMLLQTTQLDKETAVHMQNELMSLQDEIYRLKRELEFYQGVMDTTRRVTGLDIHGIYVEPLLKPNQYVIKLVLTNVATSDRVLEGKLDINFEGIQNNNKQRMNINDILISESTDLSFELKSFKRVEYVFELPAEFAVSRVQVNVNVKNANELPISKIYDWTLN